MAVAVASYSRESELVALQLQEEELQAQQDAILAQQLALAFALGNDADDFQTSDAVMQIQKQLEELRVKAGELAAESEQELATKQEEEARDSERVAHVEAQLQRWNARIAQHDQAFARKLASIDEDTWEENGANIEDPLHLPPPPQLPTANVAADAGRASASSAAVPQLPSQGSTQTPRPQSSNPHQQPKAHQQASSSCGPSASSHPSKSVRFEDTTGAGPSARSTSIPAPAPPNSSSSTKPPSAASSAAAALPRYFFSGFAVLSHKTEPKPTTTRCQSCFDDIPIHDARCAGTDAPSSSSAAPGCGHYFCAPCMTQYVRGAVSDRKCPVPCPMAAGAGRGAKGCGASVSRDIVLDVLEAFPQDQQTFHQAEALASLSPALIRYCPHKDCSCPLLWPEDEQEAAGGGQLPPDQPVPCPACKRALCPRCLVAGWHQGYTCAQFQALPPHQRSAEDAAALQLSAKQQWKQCPSCKNMVERSVGCNHIRCRCACDFCYACGKEYSDSKPTADNVHGTPACGCPLFDVPADDNDAAAAAPVPVPAAAPAAVVPGAAAAAAAVRVPAPPRPWRNGRLVSRTRCRHSASIHDCPQGVSRCWFWHDEDGVLY